MRSILGRKSRAASLAILTMGMAFSSFCSAVDVRHNAAAGTMGFIKSWVGDLLVEVVPAPGDILNGNQG